MIRARHIGGVAIIAVVGVMMLKLVFGLLMGLFSFIFWVGVLGVTLYLILKLVGPDTARRVRDIVRKERQSDPTP